jgi:hypothetical protein
MMSTMMMMTMMMTKDDNDYFASENTIGVHTSQHHEGCDCVRNGRREDHAIFWIILDFIGPKPGGIMI